MMPTPHVFSVFALMMTTQAHGSLGEYDAHGEQTILDRADRRQNFNYEIRTADGRKASTFCKTYTFNQTVAWHNSDGAFGYHISCLKQRRKNRRLAIWIHGGPWAPASKDLVLDQLAFLDSGYDLYVLLYPGSSDRPVKFEGPVMVPDVVDALAEIKVAVGWGRKHYERVDVVGESFGAFLAASAAPSLGQDNSLFLINPSLGGKNRLEEYYAGRPEDALVEGIPKERARAEVKRITDAYFARLHAYAPLRLLESAEGLKLKLVYGGRDELMKPEEIQSIVRLAVHGCGVDYRADNGHESGNTPEQFESFRELIRCGDVQRSHGRPHPKTGGRNGDDVRN
ncbi:MAG TPA: alpha/beta hydrolase [Allosphingosinicella sp.]|nr:alpha/beta hydrolase [Allosphingosinicella sp.]